MPNAELYRAISAQVSRVIAEERVRQGLSMNRLAEMTGLSLSMVSYVERGMRNPTLDTLLRLTDALALDLGVLIQQAAGSPKR